MTQTDINAERQSETEIRNVVLRSLSDVAPEINVSALDSSLDLRDQVDIDSVDFLNFVIRLHNELGIDIPDADVAKLGTLDGYQLAPLTEAPVILPETLDVSANLAAGEVEESAFGRKCDTTDGPAAGEP